MNNIISYNTYNKRMALSMDDKLFFMDMIPIKKLVDFGCANGTMLNLIQSINPDIHLLGYDIDMNMVELASRHAKSTNDWNDIKSFVNDDSVLCLSSVIHEIFSYCTSIELYNTFNKIFRSDFEYIVIRDMLPNSSIDTIPLEKSDLDNLYKYADKKYLDSFISIYGEIDTYRKLTHYLLKYRYTDNWEREVNENYLPINYEDFLNMIPSDYEVIYSNNFILEYIYQTIKADFNIELKSNTHSKLILKKIR